MHMRPGEAVTRVIRRHLTPYILSLLGIALFTIPFFAFLIAIREAFSDEVFFGIIAVFSFFVGLLISKRSVDFLLDRLIVTNKRVIHSNWKNLFRREEDEIDLDEIQDVKTIEKGVLAKFPFLNYGTIEIETAASSPSVVFQDCPHPEVAKHFILAQLKDHQEDPHK